MGWAKIRGILELMRPHNLLVAVITSYIGYGLGLKMLEGVLSVDPGFAVCAAAVALIAAGGYVVNDYYDVAIDAVNKPWRPIPSGRVSRKEALTLGLALFAAGLASAAAIGMMSFAYAVVVALILYLYSWKLKRTGLPGNIAIAFSSASTILFGALAFAEMRGYWDVLPYSLVPFCYAFVLVLAREIVKGIEDVKGDKLGGVQTLAVVLGTKAAAVVASALLLLIVALSPLPLILKMYNYLYGVLALFVDALALASVIMLLKSRDLISAAARARAALKWAFLFGALAFVAGLA